ncbi:unnamed protein product [Schistocephalus solidus]|uniref:GRIP domain-containing protein n=1 Tax=Schistocephalus solidus TaxID=70667 RepID=A0A183T700_SCHSO|nr:unnamed protein product [Schistocephalus solidus]
MRSNWKEILLQNSLPKSQLELSHRDDKFAAVEKQLGQMYSTRQSLQAQIQSLDEEVEQRRELRDRMPSLRELVEINQSLSKQVADAKAEKQSLQRELKRVIKAEVNRALDQVSYMHGEIAKSESEKTQLKMELSNLQFEIKTLASKASTEKEIEQITFKQREEAIIRERRDFERQVNEAQKCNEELKNSKEKEIGALQKELSTAQGVILSLRAEIEDLRRKVTDGNIRCLKLTEQHSCTVDSYKKKLNDLTEAKECRLKLNQQSRVQSTPIMSARHVQTETAQREDPVRWDAPARRGLAASPSIDSVSSLIGGSELWKEELKLLRDATQASLQLAQQELKKEREISSSQAATIRCLEEKIKTLITERAEETKAFSLALEDKVKQECSKAEQKFQKVLAKEKAETRRLATEAVRRSLGPQLLQYKKSAAQAQKTTRDLRRRLECFYDSVLKLTNKECRKLASVLQLDLERPSLLDTELVDIDNAGELVPTRSMEDDFSNSWEKSIATSMATQSAYISELSALVKQLRRQLKKTQVLNINPTVGTFINRATE